MHVLLVGSTGYVGSEFVSQIQSRGFRLTEIGRHNCDVYSVAELANHLRVSAPDILINCAGYTGKPNVDACERDKSNCLAGNAVLPGVIAEACEMTDVPWGHVSSGCIFTGTRPDGGGFRESDAPNFSFRQNNCSFYSGTKALGEEVLINANRCYQWRVRIPFSHIDSSRNYLSKVQRYETLLEAENSLSNLGEFVAAALDCFVLNLPFGTYNMTNPGSVTTSEVVSLIQASGLVDREFRFFESEKEFMKKAAITPRSNCVLDSSKAIGAGLKLTPVKESIEAALKNWIPGSQPSTHGSKNSQTNRLAVK